MIRPRQRGRFGVPGLHLPNRPSAQEMAFDKVVVSVSGRLISALEPAQEPSDALDGYREAMRRRYFRPGSGWSRPGGAASGFDTTSKGWGTIAETKVRVRWAKEAHEISVTLTLNPTRTLLHALSMIEENGDAAADLGYLPLAAFFGRSAPVVASAAATTLDGSDNAFDHLGLLTERMGRDHAAAFIGPYESQLKRWTLEAVAPPEAGFSHDTSGPILTAINGVHRVAVDWGHLFLRSAEIYCERRHADAVALMNRMSSTVQAAHAESFWRSYDIGELGGRAAGSATIGIRPTSRIKQVYYAKKTDRIRIETRYEQRVRDNLRGTSTSPVSPLHDLLLGLRNDAVQRIRWDAFCAMAEEPPTPLMTDFARLVGVVARCCAEARVDPERVFKELLGAGGLDETASTGSFPRRLLHRLADAGVIHRENLQRRSRPGHPRRHHLRQPYLTIADALQRLFGSQHPPDAPRT